MIPGTKEEGNMPRVRHIITLAVTALLLTGPNLGWAQNTEPLNVSWEIKPLKSGYLAEHEFLASLKGENPTETGAGTPAQGASAFENADEAARQSSNPLLVGDYSRNELFFFGINASWKFGKPSAAPGAEAKSAK